MSYQVDLDTFRGPLDLLLYLVKRDEVDILDIPIARITAQYLQYLEVIQVIDVERAGDFLVMASTLMELKSRMLLPSAPTAEGDEEDPRLELVRQLLEYKKFKEAASLLEERAAAQAQRLSRPPAAAAPAPRPDEQPIGEVELWDLVSAFSRVLRDSLVDPAEQIAVDDTPIHLLMDAILARLAQQACLEFSEIFDAPRTRGRLVGLFLALLELIKAKRITARQEDPFGPILIELIKPEALAEAPCQ